MSDRDPMRATVVLNHRQLGQLRRRARHIAGLLEEGATSENAAAYYRAELGALRQVVDAFEPPDRAMVGTGEETRCGAEPGRSILGPIAHQTTGTCTADQAEEAA